MKIQLSHDDNLKITKKVISDFLDNFDNSEGSCLKLAIENLFKEIERELDRFISGREDLTATSMQVRNLFELYLISKHIYTSENGLNSWFGQMHKDSMDVQNGFIELFSSHNQNVTELEEIKAFIDKNLDKSPYTSKGGFNIKDLAELYGYVKDYSAIHKLCSKLIHPTSIKVNAYNALTENDNYLAVLEQVGVFFCQKIEELSHEIARSTSA
jgi:hypothetical protein